MFVRWIHMVLAVFLMSGTVSSMSCRPVLGSEGLSDAMVGTQAPPFSLRLLRDGSTVDLATQRGKVVLLDFWAIFCGPCRDSMPHVQSFNQRFPADQLRILSVNLDPVEDTRDSEVAAFVERYGYTFDVLMGNGRVGTEFGARRIPRVMLLDRNGRIRRVFQGRTHPALIEAGIEELLAEPL
jgi:thiol-disulfide isomerase/thioredoxin